MQLRPCPWLFVCRGRAYHWTTCQGAKGSVGVVLLWVSVDCVASNLRPFFCSAFKATRSLMHCSVIVEIIHGSCGIGVCLSL